MCLRFFVNLDPLLMLIRGLIGVGLIISYCHPAKAMELPAKTLRFAVYTTNSSAPFYHLDEQENYIGILPTLLNKAAAIAGIHIDFVAIDRRGAEIAIYNGDVDALILSKEWATYPDRIVFSAPMYDFNEYFFSLSPFAKGERPPDWLAGKSVCVRRDYVYPLLDPLLESGAIKVIYLSDYPAMFDMLQSGRCETVYMNEHEARWLAGQKKIQIRLYRSPAYLDSVGSTIAVRPQWQAFLPVFNQLVISMTDSGEMQKLLERSLQ